MITAKKLFKEFEKKREKMETITCKNCDSHYLKVGKNRNLYCMRCGRRVMQIKKNDTIIVEKKKTQVYGGFK